MLRTRLLTAFVVGIIGLGGIYLLQPPGFAVMVGLILTVLGGWEAARLAGFDGGVGQWAYPIGLSTAAYLLYPHVADMVWLMILACGLWLINLVWLTQPEAGGRNSSAMRTIKAVILGIALLAAWQSACLLQARSPWLVFLLLIIIAAADTGAYFSGKHFGGTKLAPRISPGKTRAGAIGGLLGAAILAPLAGSLIPESPFGFFTLASVAFGLALISIGGDLFISLLKRQRGLKDTSAILPGHGGILDRFDSMAAALPFYALAALYFSRMS